MNNFVLWEIVIAYDCEIKIQMLETLLADKECFLGETYWEKKQT